MGLRKKYCTCKNFKTKTAKGAGSRKCDYCGRSRKPLVRGPGR